jgi:glycosidase
MSEFMSLYANDIQNIIKNKSNRKYHPSPLRWEDQILYFLMLDRFSDGKEINFKDNKNTTIKSGTTPLYKTSDNGNAIKTHEEDKKWNESGTKWNGGTIKGLKSKIGYLKRMGVTAIWVSPIFKQICKTTGEETYHGYGIQNFVDIDPNFGSREELKDFVQEAHAHGIFVIMDIILNHAGNIFSYSEGDHIPWRSRKVGVKGYNDEFGQPTIPFNMNVPDAQYNKGAIWPREFQNPETFTREGAINNWDNPLEYYNGDFCNLKDIKLGQGIDYNYSVGDALRHLTEVYKFWIAYADIDGFRVDTVKHMDPGATRFFASAIHEFTQSIGKENFYLIGEITGGRWNAFDTMEKTGLDAALGINEIPGKIEDVAKGFTNPKEYFDLFRHSLQQGKDSHTWFRDKVVTMFDDHDQVRKGNNKARFCADDDGDKLIVGGLALNLLTEGIPCIYYGTEQYFDGKGGNDRYLRECMFGGDFGAFRSKNRHFFNENHDLYIQLSNILKIRKESTPLRRGRQYIRQISGNGFDFGYPAHLGDRMTTIIPWSRIFNNQEVLVAINTDPIATHTAWVVIDNYLHTEGETLKCLYSTDTSNMRDVSVEARNGKAVQISVPPGGAVIFS